MMIKINKILWIMTVLFHKNYNNFINVENKIINYDTYKNINALYNTIKYFLCDIKFNISLLLNVIIKYVHNETKIADYFVKYYNDQWEKNNNTIIWTSYYYLSKYWSLIFFYDDFWNIHCIDEWFNNKCDVFHSVDDYEFVLISFNTNMNYNIIIINQYDVVIISTNYVKNYKIYIEKKCSYYVFDDDFNEIKNINNVSYDISYIKFNIKLKTCTHDILNECLRLINKNK